MEVTTLYFESGGKEFTADTLNVAGKRAAELGIRQIVVASTHGYTAKRAYEEFNVSDCRIIAVSICDAFDHEGWTMTADERQALESLGITVLTSLHALGDDVSEGLSVIAPNRIVRDTLYTFCQGMKVAVEVVLMACDAGLIEMSKEVISIAGTGAGADTAIVVQPAYCREFKKLRILEILAKPR